MVINCCRSMCWIIQVVSMFVILTQYTNTKVERRNRYKMPPRPSDFTELPMTRKPRNMLNFGESMCVRRQLIFRDLNILPNETTVIGNKNWDTVLVTVKRSLESFDSTPTRNRQRLHFFTSTPKSCTKMEPVHEVLNPLSSVIRAFEHLSTDTDLVADGTRANMLPTIQGKHRDLSTISPETMSAILDGDYDSKMDNITIIDCRYPYEFDGGHIKGAINLYTKDSIQKFLKATTRSSYNSHVLIFHCEFSSERAPKMYRFLRSLDRDLNKDTYPRLNLPEIYLLEGGYKAFFNTQKDKCFPQTYTPMLHKEHKAKLRHFRVKSKSLSADDRSRIGSRCGSGLRLRF